MAKQQSKEQQAAVRGANLVIDHLAATGTGRDKLDVAREVLADVGDAYNEVEGAELVLAHLRRRNVAEGTIEKARAFINSGMDPQSHPTLSPAASVFVPGTTVPGTVTRDTPAGSSVPAAGKAEPNKNPPQVTEGRK